ncbi:M16 family metallopeptidase [Umboniibacter marinipuniceus]|uniref:Zinc protease n=1 Tax=Umboniibacter marinipuniceus TaxID=569599 RepID=A0A3M0AHM2_9GAMM|nr:pitrilysin family protein [Umboniibacter marinipuniceus]RMA82258.1 zinc protease [Umboniibacter marinipuniceus]
MKKLLAFSLAIFVVTGCQQNNSSDELVLPAGVRLVETVNSTPDDVVISYQKFELDNGLTVVLHQDLSDPLVDVDVTYHVGSAREQVGYSGFAHFFEHMMFQGSEHVADEEHFGIITESGGTLNGTTNSDRTNYFNTAPSNQLATLLWLESDRMGFLLDAITEETFENQRETVKNERGQRVDNAPYGRVWETMAMHTYPAGHPYSWPVIGHMDDLNRAQVDAVKQFFLRWYGPNNATLTIGGDIDVSETLEMVVKYFGSIPAGPEVEKMPAMPAVLDSDRYATLEDRIFMPALAMSFPTVSLFDQDEPALDAAAKIIGQGASSILYKNLVQTGRALSASLNHSCSELACTMTAIVVQNRQTGENLADMEQAVRESFDEFVARGVSDDDVARFITDVERSQVFGLQSVSGKVRQLAYYETFLGTPNGMANELSRYRAVTADQVTDAFNRFIVGKPAVIVSVVPMGMTELAAGADNHEVEQLAPEEPMSGLAFRPATDSFDRSARPAVPNAKPISLPTIWEGELANGVRVLGVTNTETPTSRVVVGFEVGQRDLEPGQEGLSSFTAALMSEATTNYSLAELDAMQERIGASVGFNMSDYQASASLSVLTDTLDGGMEILVERLLNPAFNEADVERIRGEILQGIQQSKTSGPALAQDALNQAMGKPSNPLAHPSSGTTESVSNISRDDLVSFYSANFPEQMAIVLVSSNLSQEEVLSALSPLGEIAVAMQERPIEQISWQAPEANTIYFMDKPEAAQSSIRIATNGPLWDVNGDYWHAQLMNFNLGGNFNSRINQNLREDKGYTYGARSGFSGDMETGTFIVSAEVRADSTLASIQEVLAELAAFKAEGMTEAELNFMRSAYSQRDARAYETPSQKLRLISQMATYNVDASYLDQRNEALANAQLNELNALANRLITDDRLAIVVVGDKATVYEDLQALGLPIVELQPTE